MRSATWLLAIAPLAQSACLATGEDTDDGEGAFSISVSAADTARVFDVVNYPGVVLETLDDGAGLDVRAATNIIAHRNGPDGVSPSADDDWYDSLAELDAVKYVGDAALARLIQFAHDVPTIPSAVTIEGVAFRGWEAEAVVWGATHSTVEQLDVVLDIRAARALVAARPSTMAQVGAAAYVGPTALVALRGLAMTWWPLSRASEPPATCDVVLTARADATADDLNTLLEVATTLDYPWGEVIAAQAPACLDVANDRGARDKLVNALLTPSPLLSWAFTNPSEAPRPTTTGMVAGSTAFGNLARAIADVVQDRVDSGMWTPANPDEQALYQRMPQLIAALTGVPADDVLELPMHLDADECSQDAVAAYQVSTHRIWIVHHFPGC